MGDRFLGGQRAHAVGQPTTRANDRRGRGEDPPLQFCKHNDVSFRDPPPGIGAAPQRSEAAAGSIDQDFVER
jgi:hypothetical protein